MAKIQGNGRPTQFTEGVRGDVYTDLNTGKRYECLGYDGFIGRGQSDDLVKYDWIELKEYGGVSNEGGSGECDWNTMKNKPFGDISETEVKTLDEKYIPASIQRVNNNATTLIKANLNGQEYKIPAGQTTTNKTPSIEYNLVDAADMEDIVDVFCVAVGDYITSEIDEGYGLNVKSTFVISA